MIILCKNVQPFCMRKVLLAICICSFSLTLQGQVKYSNEFMNIGVGARAFAMGGAVVSQTTDASAGYWNPAGLTGLTNKWDATLMHAEYFAGLAKYDYGAVAYRIDDNSAAGLSLIRLGVDDIPNTLELIDADGNMRYDRIRTFSAADLGVILSYARELPIEGLSVGGNAKIIYRRTGEFANAWGFGLDASARWVRNQWIFSAVARDITTTFNAWTFHTDQLQDVFAMTGNELPENSLEVTLPRIIIGASRTFKIGDQFALSAETDLQFTTDGKRPVLLSLGFTGIDPYAGAELGYKNWLFFRLGAGQFQWVPGLEGQNELTVQPAVGLGLRFRGIMLDYALTDPGDLAISQYSNIISIRYAFGG